MRAQCRLYQENCKAAIAIRGPGTLGKKKLCGQVTMRFQMEIVLYVVLRALSIIVALFVGGFAKSYMSKKGENAALREDVAELTRTTKKIEAEISGDMWDRQKRWELKRDLLSDLTKKTAGLSDALTRLHAVYMTEKFNEQQGQPARLEQRMEVGQKWSDAADAFDQASLLASMVCGKETRNVLNVLSLLSRDTANKITGGEPESFTQGLKEWVPKREAIMVATRKELGID